LELEDPDRKSWWDPEGDLPIHLEEQGDDRYAVVAEGIFLVNPADAAAGRSLEPGQYVVWFTGQLLGVGRRRRLVMPASLRSEQRRWQRVAGTAVAARLDWSLPGNRIRLEIRKSKSDSGRDGCDPNRPGTQAQRKSAVPKALRVLVSRFR
jgi:hypothetical protein